MTWEDNYLAHFGIKGQKWGIRRYQNEDGSLTEEGRQRYLSNLTPEQKRAYQSLTIGDRRRLEKKLASGKDFNRAQKELIAQETAKGLGIAVGLMYLSPVTRPMIKAAGRSILRMGKSAFSAAKNSKAAQKGSLYIKQLLKRRTMMKNGAVSLKKSQFSVKDYAPKFGGYLN